jgi:hypothetical protein
MHGVHEITPNGRFIVSRFYGNVQGNRGEATRRGVSTMRTACRSYNGSVIVTMSIVAGEDYVQIQMAQGSAAYGGVCLYSGPIKDLLDMDKRKFLLRALVHEEIAERAGMVTR